MKKDVVHGYLDELSAQIRGEKGRLKPRTSNLFSALQKQHLLRKILKEKAAIDKQSLLEEKDMFRACQIGYEGLEELRDDSTDKLIALIDEITVEKYKEALVPLGNFILGYKTVKEFCKKYLEPEKLKNAENIYKEMKKRVTDIDKQTNKRIEGKYTITLQRDYGVKERIKKSKGGMGTTTPETIWNVKDYPLTEVDDLAIIDVISAYNKQTGKNYMWRGAKTQPFLKFLSKFKMDRKL